MKDHGPKFAGEDLEPARIGLLDVGSQQTFDPAFAVLSPIEMVLAPTAGTFDFPLGSKHGAFTYHAQPFPTPNHSGDTLTGIGSPDSDPGDPVYAAADGKVLSTARQSKEWGNTLILLHERPNGEMVGSFYGFLDSIHVPIGAQVRRGEILGTIATANGHSPAHLQFALRPCSSLDLGTNFAASEQGRFSGESTLVKWRGRAEDQLAAPPAGEPLEPSPLSIGVEGESTH